MLEKFGAEMQPQGELILKQTKGGMYSSIPSVEDVLEEMGIKDESKEEVFKYDETLRGAYDSKPSVEDVSFELGLSENKENDWEQAAEDRGHGQYVRNVEAAVAFCRARGVKTKEEVQAILAKAEPSTTYAEYAMDRGHGEYVRNVEAVAKFAKARGASSREGVEEILSEAKVEES